MIAQCLNMYYVNDFMAAPEIRRYASEYGAEMPVFETTGREAWLSYSIDDVDVGLIHLELITGCAALFHPYILREYKDKYDEMVQEFFGWFISTDQEEITKLNVIIPEVCKGALKAANKARMTVEGVDRESFLTENGPCGRIMLGITRKELINE